MNCRLPHEGIDTILFYALGVLGAAPSFAIAGYPDPGEWVRASSLTSVYERLRQRRSRGDSARLCSFPKLSVSSLAAFL